ncbi:dihydrodipicolinate synthase family protein [Streptosporangium saharense]|uniref:dihydrodipicolinate synthase family protein n=1 Tax=Streptosporangium saharense TaxID=1706840 RepID=UPI0036A6FDE8
MPLYTKAESREWAREHMRGTANTTIASYSADLRTLNEQGIRHDIRRALELGFGGTLVCAETAMSLDEYERFTAWAADEADGRLHVIFHAAFNTLEENIEAARRASAAGADYALLSYPANFHPTSESEVYAYTRAFCDAVDLGVMLFPVPLWNFSRLHPADISPEMLEVMVKEIPNVVAIKAEGAMPLTAGLLDVHRRLADTVVISCPLEKEVIPLMGYVPFQYSGTSNFEYYGTSMPRMFDAASQGDMDTAMDIYWSIMPARNANAAVGTYVPQTGLINRMVWKYQGWLNGMNGGPLRQPTMKASDRQMDTLRCGVVAAGIADPAEPDSAFFVGRNPS